MRASTIAVIVASALVGVQLWGRALRAPARTVGAGLRVEGTGSVCPGRVAAAPAWTRLRGTYAIASSWPTFGVTYRGAPHSRPLTFGEWREDGWRFVAANADPNYTDLVWTAFAHGRLAEHGAVRVTLSRRGLLLSAAWRSGGACRSATVRATPVAFARWLRRTLRSRQAAREGTAHAAATRGGP